MFSPASLCHRGKAQVKIEGAVFQLNEVLPFEDLLLLILRQIEVHIVQSRHKRTAITRLFFHEEIGILRRIRKSQKDGARFANKQITHASLGERAAYFLSLTIFKRAHNPTILEGSRRTSGDIPR